MIQEFQIQNFFSIRERQTLSFLPTNDDKMRSQYLYEVAEGVDLLKIGIVYGSNAAAKPPCSMPCHSSAAPCSTSRKTRIWEWGTFLFFWIITAARSTSCYRC